MSPPSGGTAHLPWDGGSLGAIPSELGSVVNDIERSQTDMRKTERIRHTDQRRDRAITGSFR
jgi:hypothetical protein